MIMSHWNPLEKQLRCWTPRPPAASLKARLFGPGAAAATAAAAVERRHHHPTTWHWLAPSMAVFFLGLFLYGQAGLAHQFNRASAASMIATAALSRPELSAYYDSPRHSDNNALRNTLEWTNGNSSLSTAPPMAQTN